LLFEIISFSGDAASRFSGFRPTASIRLTLKDDYYLIWWAKAHPTNIGDSKGDLLIVIFGFFEKNFKKDKKRHKKQIKGHKKTQKSQKNLCESCAF
jgi:hypothetical protein